jgi:hypothetical protein
MMWRARSAAETRISMLAIPRTWSMLLLTKRAVLEVDCNEWAVADAIAVVPLQVGRQRLTQTPSN